MQFPVGTVPAALTASSFCESLPVPVKSTSVPATAFAKEVANLSVLSSTLIT